MMFSGCLAGRPLSVCCLSVDTYFQGSHASWKVLESPEFFLKFPGPEKSWKMRLVLKSR